MAAWLPALAANWDSAGSQWVAAPIDVSSASGEVYLSLYGSGFRGRSSLAAVSATVGGTAVDVQYAGSHSTYAGLDQLNLKLPPSLSGRGDVPVRITVDGQACNIVSVNIR